MSLVTVRRSKAGRLSQCLHGKTGAPGPFISFSMLLSWIWLRAVLACWRFPAPLRSSLAAQRIHCAISWITNHISPMALAPASWSPCSSSMLAHRYIISLSYATAYLAECGFKERTHENEVSPLLAGGIPYVTRPPRRIRQSAEYIAKALRIHNYLIIESLMTEACPGLSQFTIVKRGIC